MKAPHEPPGEQPFQMNLMGFCIGTALYGFMDLGIVLSAGTVPVYSSYNEKVNDYNGIWTAMEGGDT